MGNHECFHVRNTNDQNKRQKNVGLKASGSSETTVDKPMNMKKTENVDNNINADKSIYLRKTSHPGMHQNNDENEKVSSKPAGSNPRNRVPAETRATKN